MGYADALIKLNIPYNSETAVSLSGDLMEYINIEAKRASELLAETRGNFPSFNKSVYTKDKPIRNAARTCLPPTGTISILADTSPGIEPLFSVVYQNIMVDPADDSKTVKFMQVHPIFECIAKKRRFYTKALMKKIEKYGSIQNLDEIPDDLKEIFVTSHDISPEWHIRTQAAFQRHTDAAVSKTINFANSATVQDVSNAYLQAYRSGCKGITIYRDGSRDIQALTKGTNTPGKTTVLKEPMRRPKKLHGMTYSLETGCGKIYITINMDENGHPFECFANIGKAGGCSASQCEAIGRLTSLSLRNNFSPEEITKQLIGISCHKPFGFGPDRNLSCADAIGKAILDCFNSNGKTTKVEASLEDSTGSCMECGGQLQNSGGCSTCMACGHSACG